MISMTEEEIGQTIMRAVTERNEGRRQLASVNRRLGEIEQYLTALGKELAFLRESRAKYGDDIRQRLLRNEPDGTPGIVTAGRIHALLAERDQLIQRIDQAIEYLREMGIEESRR